MIGSVVTFGETMAMVTTDRPGVLSRGDAATWSFGGADSNVAIGLARLGVRVTWFGRVGDDAPGRMIAAGIRGEGVNTVALIDDSAPTGLMLKFRRTSDRVSVLFRREHSAGSHLAPEDLVSHPALSEASIVHCTGITPALSNSARIATFAAVRQGREHGALISFDVNYRPSLWSRMEATAYLSELARECDLVFASPDEIDLALPNGIDAFLAARPDRVVVIKNGEHGATGYTAHERIEVPAVHVTAHDTVGAGDAFVAGFLSSHLELAPLEENLRRAVVTGAFACTSSGDWEGAPSLHELDLLSAPDPVSR